MQIPVVRKGVERKRAAEAALAEARNQIALLERGANYETLKGTRYARYALPLDYLPSRDLRPRWGYSRPPIATLHRWFADHADEYRAFIVEMRTAAAELTGIARNFDAARLPAPAWLGTAVNPIDVLALYTFVRKYRPATYLEIGSGITTCFAHLARKHGNLSTKIISIDPKPRAGIDAICDTIIRDGLETCDLSIFATLNPGDIVFLDGSHRVFMNSDVTVFFIDILPMIKPGVIVHVHDITLPWDYHEYFVNWYWSEQYLMAVYLMGNLARIDPLFPAAFVTTDPMFKTDLATPLIRSSQPLPENGGGSMWFTHR